MNPEKYTPAIEERIEEQKNDTYGSEETADDEHVNKLEKSRTETSKSVWVCLTLWTQVSTCKVTLASTGPFSGPIHNPRYILSQPFLFDDRLMHVCGIENVAITHPTLFHESYLEGSWNYEQTDGTVYEVLSYRP